MIKLRITLVEFSSLFFVLSVILSLMVAPSLLEGSFCSANRKKEKTNYRHTISGKKFADLDAMTCKQGNLLLQKNGGVPVCVMPSTYLKLVGQGIR